MVVQLQTKYCLIALCHCVFLLFQASKAGTGCKRQGIETYVITGPYSILKQIKLIGERDEMAFAFQYQATFLMCSY
jgi:hypothetical protein